MSFEGAQGKAAWIGVMLALVMGCDSSASGDDDDDSSSAVASCPSFCDKAQRAACADFDHGACIGYCADVADMAMDTTQCSSEFGRLLECVNGLSDVCAAFRVDDSTSKLEACNSESEDVGDCRADYCQDHAAADYCR